MGIVELRTPPRYSWEKDLVQFVPRLALCSGSSVFANALGGDRGWPILKWGEVMSVKHVELQQRLWSVLPSYI